MPEMRFLTPAQEALLQEALDRLRNMPKGRNSADQPDEPQAPEVYIARPANNGSLPGMTSPGTCDTCYPQPGFGDCDICRIYMIDGVPEIRLIGQAPKRVYNLSEETLRGWILVHRDKFGNWLTSNNVGTEPAQPNVFEVGKTQYDWDGSGYTPIDIYEWSGSDWTSVGGTITAYGPPYLETPPITGTATNNIPAGTWCCLHWHTRSNIWVAHPMRSLNVLIGWRVNGTDFEVQSAPIKVMHFGPGEWSVVHEGTDQCP